LVRHTVSFRVKAGEAVAEGTKRFAAFATDHALNLLALNILAFDFERKLLAQFLDIRLKRIKAEHFVENH
jgi:hypothetical protein